jgi:hypothetical protein
LAISCLILIFISETPDPKKVISILRKIVNDMCEPKSE